MDSREDVYESKERWLILAIVANQEKLLSVDVREDESGKRYLLWRFALSEKILELDAMYNERRPIILDLHDLIAASDLFKRNMQRYHIR